MNAPVLNRRMTVEQFLEWVDARVDTLSSDEPKWELFDGTPVMQDHEKWIHGRIKLSIVMAMKAAIARAGLPLEAAVDSLGVRIGPHESYQPEVVVFPAGQIGDDDRFAPDPIVVVEVLSPSTRKRDITTKTAGYAKVPSIAHYLIVDPDRRTILHCRRIDGSFGVSADPVADRELRLQPPGIVLSVADLFA